MTWQPGQSGNPEGGRIRKKNEFPFTSKDIKHHFLKWKQLIETGKMSDAVRLRATERFVEFCSHYLYGKPQQSLDLNVDKPLAAIVNISLGSSGDVVAQQTQPVTIDAAPAQKEIEVSQPTTEAKLSVAPIPGWLEPEENGN